VDLVRDIRYAVRSLRSAPLVTITAMAVLALGIGVTTAIFTMAYGVLLRPLPFADPDRLVQVGTIGILEFQAYREQSRSFDRMVAYGTVTKNLQAPDGAERVVAVTAERALFDLLGVRPLAGRTFTSADPVRTAVVSEGFWRRRTGGFEQPGSWTILFDNEPHAIVGIMPASFRFPSTGPAPEAWIVTDLPRTDSWFQRIDAAVARLRPDVALDTARAELQTIASRLEPLTQSNPTRALPLTPLTEAVVGRSRQGLLMLLGAAAVVLLIACANVASLLLARAEERRREIAVRLALGARRGRLVRQFLVESLLLALTATIAAVGVAAAGTRALVALAGREIPRASELGFDWTAFVFLLGVALATGLVFGLAPALHLRRADVSGILSSARSSKTPRSVAIGGALVVCEIALTFVLLAGSALLLRAFVNLQLAPTGVTTDQVVTLRLDSRGVLPPSPAGDDAGRTAQGRYFQAIEDRVRQLPGVRAAGLVTRLHLQSAGNTGQFTIPGRPGAAGANFPVRLREVSPGYFEALGVSLRAGRLFTDRDRDIVVNEALVRQHFGSADPIGQVLDRGTIVGVVGDIRQSVRQPAEPEIYRPLAATSYSAATLVVSSPLPPEQLVGSLRAAIRDINPNQAMFDVQTMEDVLMAAHGDVNISLSVVGLLGALALMLSAAGIYSVMAYAVAARRREMGIRIALGASRGRVLQLVLGQGATLAIIGVAIGAAGALALTRSLRAVLYEISPSDPLTFVLAAAVITAIAMLAALAPARRATAVDPMTVLRAD
jgi:putative ABC transport system permease protein